MDAGGCVGVSYLGYSDNLFNSCGCNLANRLATAAGVKRVDPAWIIVGRSHGGRPVDIIRRIILPAVTPDLLTGIRLALGVAWIVLVPAEYLGVTSGLGYAINDARDTLSYDILAALILLIGLIGFSLDFILLWALKRASWVPAS